MEKERYIKDDEVLNIIKDVIYELHPVMRPRIYSWAYLEKGIKMPEMEIRFYFYNDDDLDTKTQIMFLDGTESCKHEIPTTYVVDAKISMQTIGKLISFLLTEFPYMRSLHESPNGFGINFNIGLEHEEQEGISLSAIDINFDTHPRLYSEFRELFRDYLEYIINSFYGYVSRTPEFKNAYNRYSDKIKRETIDSLSYIELQNLLRLIDENRLRELLLGMNNDDFFELCNSFQKSNETTKRKILELKERTINDVIGN